jgi:phospholipase C
MVAKPLVVAASLTLLVGAGCGSNGAFSSVPAQQQQSASGMRPATGHPVSQYISHVIVIVQENRSFENFFAGFPGANAPMFGCVGSNPSGAPSLRARSGSGSGCLSGDTQVPLHPITFVGPDLKHDWHSSMVSWDNGRMDGFWKFGHNSGVYDAYAYVSPDLIIPYMTLANTYVLADEMFPTEFGGSFTAHLTLVAGTDGISNKPLRAEVDFPTAPPDDCDSPPGTTSSYINKDRKKHFGGPFPCFDQFNTLAEVMDKAKVSWKYYVTKHVGAGDWSPFEAIKYVRYNRDWHRNVISPQTKILTDPGSSNLASVSFVTPSKADSDHPGDHSDLGPSWVANVVNAIGESPYWNTSAIILLWDDWGGWYDNAAPPQLDYRGLGIRVPCLIISPYSRETSPSHPGYISHTQYEFGSILRFIEETFNLPYIGPQAKGYTDERAAPLDDSFDFTQTPRPFVPITPKYPRSRFLHEPPSNEPVDTE